MATLITTRDLTKQPPHSPRERIAGFAIALRAVDKCRASLAGTPGEYHFDCPLDNMLFSFKGITGEQFKTAVQAAINYEDVGAWLQVNGANKTPEEIKRWSDEMEAGSLMKDPAKRGYFIENCHKLGLNPQMNTTFDWLEADDRESLRRATATPPPVGAPASAQTPVFPQTLHHLRPDTRAAGQGSNPKKRNNIFSKSRDNRENRGARQMKTSRNPQSGSRGR